jgi:hypothetical protein
VSVSGDIRLTVGAVSASFDPATGSLRQFKRGSAAIALTNGPRLVFAKPKASAPTWIALDPSDAGANIQRIATPQMANLIEVNLALEKSDSYAGFKLEITADGKAWKTLYSGTRRGSDGSRYSFPPQFVSGIRISNPVRDSGAPIAVKDVSVGFEADRFPIPPPTPSDNQDRYMAQPGDRPR